MCTFKTNVSIFRPEQCQAKIAFLEIHSTLPYSIFYVLKHKHCATVKHQQIKRREIYF